MAEYSNLSATINAQIRANGVQAITGPVLNAVLTAMVNVLGDGYRLAGVAHPADNPGSPDNRVAYLAAEDGTYTDFGGLAVSGEVALLLWDSVWTKATLVSIDAVVTPGSDNLVTSGAVAAALSALATRYMALVPTATEGNLAEFDNAGQVRDAGIATSDLATKDGHYPDLFAGFAGNLVDTRSAGTRQGPFAFRQSGGDGVNYMRKILGRTEAFNQLVDDPNVEVTLLNGHTYLLHDSTPQVWRVVTRTSDTQYNPASNNCDQIIDLTLQGLGLTTADQFRVLHPLPYYNYNAGVLKNNAATGLETTGFNQWDEEWENGYISVSTGENLPSSSTFRSKNYIPVVAGASYYATQNYNTTMYVLCYDANKTYLGVGSSRYYSGPLTNLKDGTAYIRFYLEPVAGTTTYNHDICINLSDASRNGIYEPYWKREIVLGLNNLACHDENNNAVVVNGLDGVGTAQDELVVENGWGTKINKKRARVDLGSLTWAQSYAGSFAAPFTGYKAPASSAAVADALCSKYVLDSVNNVASSVHMDKTIGLSGGGDTIYIYDASFAGLSAADVKAALAGVYLDYPLATPKVLTLDNPIPALIEVDNLGTEKRLPEDTAADPQAPFECDSNYSVSTANLVRLLNL